MTMITTRFWFRRIGIGLVRIALQDGEQFRTETAADPSDAEKVSHELLIERDGDWLRRFEVVRYLDGSSWSYLRSFAKCNIMACRASGEPSWKWTV